MERAGLPLEDSVVCCPEGERALTEVIPFGKAFSYLSRYRAASVQPCCTLGKRRDGSRGSQLGWPNGACWSLCELMDTMSCFFF